jgi:hypothetical protein
MEIKRCESEIVVKRISTILDKTTLMEKGIKIPNPKRFMWTQTKQNYDKHVEQMENWKDFAKEENWASKVRVVTLFLMD